jgi:hypothetical protein
MRIVTTTRRLKLFVKRVWNLAYSLPKGIYFFR